MTHPDRAVVTGAFSYTGGFIARRLLRSGVRVTTLTRHPDIQNAFGGEVNAAPLDFSDRAALSRSMEGAEVLYNTYWIRFERGDTTFDGAVENSKFLFEAAIDAGISKIVHISVSNPSPNSQLPYFSGKWRVEEALQDSGIPHAIIRPTLVFGKGDLLLNNIAWALRRFPFFPIYRNGNYQVQPIYAEDLATQAVAAASTTENFTADAAGPETLSFGDLLSQMASAMGVRRRFIPVPPTLGLAIDKRHRTADARRSPNPRRDRRPDVRPPHIRCTTHRHNQIQRLANRKRRRYGSQLPIRTTPQLPSLKTKMSIDESCSSGIG